MKEIEVGTLFEQKKAVVSSGDLSWILLDCLVQTFHYVDKEMEAWGHYAIEPKDGLLYLLFCLEPKAQLKSRCQM